MCTHEGAGQMAQVKVHVPEYKDSCCRSIAKIYRRFSPPVTDKAGSLSWCRLG